MHNLGTGKTDKELVIKLSTEELSANQVRLIKSINSVLAHVLAADEEGEYFDASAELMKQVATAINQSNFSVQNKNMDYGTQAVEYSVDSLSETLDGKNLINIDN